MRTIHTRSSASLLRELIAAGYLLDRIRGSHHVLTKAGCRPIVVPHPKKTLGKGLIAAIRRQAGL
ncbi:MAG: type II toxin-antitoxin system HicA family toxin [Pseudomonadota bacterium]|nr:type II toxin-antitoxin system HicA family toxin [Pseudomonadota bacterium]